MDTDRYMYILSVTRDDIVITYFIHMSFSGDKQLTENLIFIRTKSKDKKDRATAEQVMDPRTRMILFKFLQRGLIAEINGCISTGKEANVYHATTQNQGDRAIKVQGTACMSSVMCISF